MASEQFYSHYLITLKEKTSAQIFSRILVKASSIKKAMQEIDTSWFPLAFEAYDFEVIEIRNYTDLSD